MTDTLSTEAELQEAQALVVTLQREVATEVDAAAVVAATPPLPTTAATAVEPLRDVAPELKTGC